MTMPPRPAIANTAPSTVPRLVSNQFPTSTEAIMFVAMAKVMPSTAASR